MTAIGLEAPIQQPSLAGTRLTPGDLGWIGVPTLAPVIVGLMPPAGSLILAGELALAIGAAALTLFRLRSRPVALFASILLWLTIERLVVALLAPRLDGDSLQALLAYKESFFPILALILLPRVPQVWRSSPRSLRLVDGLAIGFCVLLLGAALLSDAGVLDRIVNGRRLVQLPLIYLAARLVPWSPTTASGVVRTLVAAAVGVSLFGLLEVSVAEAPIWRSVVPAAYYYHLSSESGLSATGTDFPIGGLPVIFYDFATGQAHRRLVSTFLEPTTVASFLALAAGIAAALGTVRRSFRIASMSAAFVIGLAAVLTLSKAGWLILGASIGYVIVASVFARLREPGWLISMAATLLGALIVVAVALQRTGVAQGPLAHFQGLEEGLNSALRAPLGLGVGFGGNFGASKLGAESTFGVTLVQLGWPGLVLWCGWLIGLVVAMATIGARVPGQQLVALAIGAALCGYLGTAALTESAGGLLGNWLYPWIAAAFVTVGAAQRSTTPPLGSDP